MPTRDEIKQPVIAKIAAVAHVAVSRVVESASLEEDLGMTTTVRRAMALPYNGVLADHGGGASITMDEAGKLETVKESIDLVAKKANGK